MSETQGNTQDTTEDGSWSDDMNLGAAPPDQPNGHHRGRRTDLDLKNQAVEALDTYG